MLAQYKRSVRQAINRITIQSCLKKLAQHKHEDGRRLSSVISCYQAGGLGDGSPPISVIEAWRDDLQKREEPLVDGTLGAGGLYDEGVTIQTACKVSKPARQATLLYHLIREFQPAQAVELGCNVGISAAYQAAALQLNGHGALTTFEASPYRLRLAQALHAKVELGNIRYEQGLFTETLEPALRNLEPVDYAFIDGHHQYQPTLDYFDLIWRHSAENAVFVFDDIRWSEGMKRAWQEIAADPRAILIVDCNAVGVCITTRNPPAANRYVSPVLKLF